MQPAVGKPSTKDSCSGIAATLAGQLVPTCTTRSATRAHPKIPRPICRKGDLFVPFISALVDVWRPGPTSLTSRALWHQPTRGGGRLSIRVTELILWKEQTRIAGRWHVACGPHPPGRAF